MRRRGLTALTHHIERTHDGFKCYLESLWAGHFNIKVGNRKIRVLVRRTGTTGGKWRVTYPPRQKYGEDMTQTQLLSFLETV